MSMSGRTSCQPVRAKSRVSVLLVAVGVAMGAGALSAEQQTTGADERRVFVRVPVGLRVLADDHFRILRDAAPGPIRYVIYSHSHADHTGGRPLHAIHFIEVARGAAPEHARALQLYLEAHEQLMAESGVLNNAYEQNHLQSDINETEEALEELQSGR